MGDTGAFIGPEVTVTHLPPHQFPILVWVQINVKPHFIRNKNCFPLQLASECVPGHLQINTLMNLVEFCKYALYNILKMIFCLFIDLCLFWRLV